MAIVQCSECGGKVSTKAEACPHCSSPLEPQFTCLDCGEAFEASLTACPVCGGPNEEHEVVVEKQARMEEAQRKRDAEREAAERKAAAEKQARMEEAKKKWDRHKRLYLSSIIALVLVLGVGATYLVRSAQERAAEEAAEAQAAEVVAAAEAAEARRRADEEAAEAQRRADEEVRPFEQYDSNGQLRIKGRRSLARGLHGPYEEFSSRGQLILKGNYNMGQRCGEWLEDGETVTYPRCPPDLEDGN